MAENTAQGPQLIELTKGRYLFEEGHGASFAYVLKEGEIEIVRASTDGMSFYFEISGS